MSLARDVTAVGGATLVSRLFGFARDVGIAALLGAGVYSDAFFAVLQLVNFFRRLLAEGALNSAFVPMWLRIKDASGAAGANRFFQEVLGATIVTLGVLAAIGVLFAPAAIFVLAPGFGAGRHALAVDYLRLAAPYVVFAGIGAVMAAVLNAERRFGAVALGIVAFNAVLLLALAWAALRGIPPSSQTGALLAQAIVLAGAGQLAVVGVGFLRLAHGPARPRFGLSADAWRFFVLAGPGLIAAGIPQLKLIAGAMVASSSQAAMSWLYYANRLYELPLGVASIVIAAVLVPIIAASVRSGERNAVAAAQSRSFELALALALPAAAAMAILAAPIAGGLFERGAFGPRDTAAVAAALAAISAGLPGHVLEKVLGAVSFAHEDTRTPMNAALAGLAAAIAGALALFPHYGHVGVAAAIAISGWVGATLLGVILYRRGWLCLDAAAKRRLPLIVVATAVMAAAILAAQLLLAATIDASGSQLVRIGSLALFVAIGLAAYLASLELSGVARLREIVAAIRHRL